MKLSAYWHWDARIVGTGDTPAQDHHLTILEGLTIPSRASFVFPQIEAIRALDLPKPLSESFKWDELPILAATRIGLDLQITED